MRRNLRSKKIKKIKNKDKEKTKRKRCFFCQANITLVKTEVQEVKIKGFNVSNAIYFGEDLQNFTQLKLKNKQ